MEKIPYEHKIIAMTDNNHILSTRNETNIEDYFIIDDYEELKLLDIADEDLKIILEKLYLIKENTKNAIELLETNLNVRKKSKEIIDYDFSLFKTLKEIGYDPEKEHPIGELLTVEEFKGAVGCTALVDDDGCGYLVKDDIVYAYPFYPSEVDTIPEGTTHILWFNK